MIFVAVGIFFFLALLWPPLAFVFALFLIALWVLTEISLRRERRLAEPDPVVELLLELEDSTRTSDRIIVGRDHPLAAIGGVPRDPRR